MSASSLSNQIAGRLKIQARYDCETMRHQDAFDFPQRDGRFMSEKVPDILGRITRIEGSVGEGRQIRQRADDIRADGGIDVEANPFSFRRVMAEWGFSF